VQAFWDSVDHLMDNSYRQAASASGQPTMSTDARAALYGAKVSHAWALGGGVLKAGIDGYARQWNNVTSMKMGMGTSTASSIPDVTLRDLGLYGEYAIKPLAPLTLKAGLRYDYANTVAAAVNEALLAQFRPYYPAAKASAEASGVGGNLQATYAVSDQLELFAGLARAVRLPDPQELYQSTFSTMGTSWVGNPTLRPTKFHQADLGARYRMDWLSLNASVFGAYAQDYIYLTSLDPTGMPTAARTYANQDAQLMGGELGAEAALPMNLFLNAGLGYVQGQNLTSGNPLAETPPLKGTVALRYDVDTFFAEVAENAAATQNRIDPTLQEIVTPGWMTTDLKVGVKWNQATLLAGINNLFDAYYTTDLAYRRDPFSSGVQVPEPGRNLYVGVSYRF
ncbi:MAG TPA: TonB-dependent receptor, partial [Stenomitos sp.]